MKTLILILTSFTVLLIATGAIKINERNQLIKEQNVKIKNLENNLLWYVNYANMWSNNFSRMTNVIYDHMWTSHGVKME